MDREDYEGYRLKSDYDYRVAFEAWWRTLSQAKKSALRECGITGPRRSEASISYKPPVDSEHLEDSLSLSEEAMQVPEQVSRLTLVEVLEDHLKEIYGDSFELVVTERISEAVRRFIGDVMSHNNPLLSLDCTLLATGTAHEGSDEVAIAKKHKVGKAAVSQRCVQITELLGLQPRGSMLPSRTRESYSKERKRQYRLEEDFK